MVKCMLDGELVVLGGPNRLEASYYLNDQLETKNPPRRPDIVIDKSYSIHELARSCKVVDEVFDKKGTPRFKIVYVPCLDWSKRSQSMIDCLIKNYWFFLGKEFSNLRGIDPRIILPKIISVVQDKDYWPGSELEDPLVLQRRVAKEKEYKENPQIMGGFEPDHKIVRHHVMRAGCANSLKEETRLYTYSIKMKRNPSRHPYSIEGYISRVPSILFGDCRDEDDEVALVEEKRQLPSAPGFNLKDFSDELEYREACLKQLRNHIALEDKKQLLIAKSLSRKRTKALKRSKFFNSLIRNKSRVDRVKALRNNFLLRKVNANLKLKIGENTPPAALVEEKEQLLSAPHPIAPSFCMPLENFSYDPSYHEGCSKETKTQIALEKEEQLLSAQSSHSPLKRFKPDSDGGFLFDLHIPKKSRKFAGKVADADE